MGILKETGACSELRFDFHTVPTQIIIISGYFIADTKWYQNDFRTMSTDKSSLIVQNNARV